MQDYEGIAKLALMALGVMKACELWDQRKKASNKAGLAMQTKQYGGLALRNPKYGALRVNSGHLGALELGALSAKYGKYAGPVIKKGMILNSSHY